MNHRQRAVCAASTLPDQSPRLGDGLKPEFVAVFVVAALVQPRKEILTLTDVETAEFVTTLHHNLDSVPGYAHTATDGKFSQRREMQANASQRGIGDCRAAEGVVQVGQVWTAQRKHLCGRIREGTTEGLAILEGQ